MPGKKTTLKSASKKIAEAKDKSLESWIWDAACSIRGAKDAPKYKDYILPLIFTKRLCDAGLSHQRSLILEAIKIS